MLTAALSASGATTAAQLYAPYGSSRYASGTMPTDYGYTGQRTDSATGLDDYGARYYDAAAAQFGSADTVADGLNRYGYVGGDPTTATDPSGHAQVIGDAGDGGGAVATAPGDPGGEHGCYPSCVTTPPAATGGGGCGGNPCMPPGGGSKPTKSCRQQEEQPSCQAWRIWEHGLDGQGGALKVRSDAINPIRASAGFGLLAAFVIDLASVLMAVATGHDLGKIIVIAIAIFETLVDIVGALQYIFPQWLPQLKSLASGITFLLAGLNAVLGLASGVVAWVAWQFVKALRVTSGGLVTFALTLAGSAVVLLMQAGAKAAEGYGYGQAAEFDRQDRMDIWIWCAGPGSGKCGTEPNNGIPQPGTP